MLFIFRVLVFQFDLLFWFIFLCFCISFFHFDHCSEIGSHCSISGLVFILFWNSRRTKTTFKPFSCLELLRFTIACGWKVIIAILTWLDIFVELGVLAPDKTIKIITIITLLATFLFLYRPICFVLDFWLHFPYLLRNIKIQFNGDLLLLLNVLRKILGKYFLWCW